jgi:hypothetical protein
MGSRIGDRPEFSALPIKRNKKENKNMKNSSFAM